MTGVTVAPATASVRVGATTTLAKTVSPSNADDQTGTWTSSNPAIATVDTKGVVRGVAAGNATVTFVTKDGGFSAKSAVTVTAS